ncbi:MAG: co-chaperone GroES [Gordonibacter sp.]|uniref:co-chaperone GroES n=1 Tax=Gordonibacter sp. TaxID=1968902 RepID=UPI002B3CEE60|nr:co-chaperone GroES [Gordonibacter sp.]
MNLKPLGDRVIIKQDEAESTTASGLYLATEAKEKPQTGTVLAVGAGKLDKDGNLLPMPVKEGDKVLYGKYGGTEITVDGEDVMILRADDLYAVFA